MTRRFPALLCLSRRLLAALTLLTVVGCVGQESPPADSSAPSAVEGGASTAPGPSGHGPEERGPGERGPGERGPGERGPEERGPAEHGAAPPSGATGADTPRPAYVFPVRGRTSYGRAHHDYPATDIFARCRAPVVAPAGGVVLEVGRRDRYRPARDDPALRSGRFVSLGGDDHVRYYGSHLRSVAARAQPGRRVRAGDLIGRVGQSGNARGTGCHLHFGISPVCARTGDWWVRRGAVWPYRFLRAWQRDRPRSPTEAVGRWHDRHGCR